MRRFAHIRREDGQALVEFALVLPILLMVATGITSFGLVFYHYITIEDAVRSGARTLSLGRGNTAPAPNDPCTPGDHRDRQLRGRRRPDEEQGDLSSSGARR